MNNYMPNNVWDEITYPVLNFNCCTIVKFVFEIQKLYILNAGVLNQLDFELIILWCLIFSM